MTHATITAHSATACIVEFPFDEQAKNAIKALPGSTYDGHVWSTAIMHLPTLKGIFGSMDVEPEVIQCYHELLKRMLCDLTGHEHCKAAQELMAKHAVGIAAVMSTGWRPTKQQRRRNVQPLLVAGAVEAKDAMLDSWLTGVKNAKAIEETQAHVTKARRRKAHPWNG